MRYVFLAYTDEKRWEAMSTSERYACESACLSNIEELRQRGYVLLAEQFQSSSATATVRVQNGRLFIADGSAAQSRQQLGRVYLVEARDLNDAIRLASIMPPARLGCIEVRPLSALDLGATS
jgi:hypothetical protein